MDTTNSIPAEEFINEGGISDEVLGNGNITSDVTPSEYIQVAPGVQLYVQDYGEGQPVILIHGWPLNSSMWEYQVESLVKSGCRVIAYDRRGFGKSSQPWDGYDYDTLTDDLKAIIDHLKLEHITLVGFSMGGGEVIRYFSRHGGAKVSRAVLIASVTPFQLKTADNPTGTPKEVMDKMADQMRNDRMSFLDDFGKTFFSASLLNHPVSAPFLNHYSMQGAIASPRATLECASAFSTTDFRDEMETVNVPVLIIHGDNDKIVPIEGSAYNSAKMIPENEFVIYEGAPHGLFYTDRKRLNEDLIKFIHPNKI
jgi:pimeloyl-ACP methyl ester carboxylesterase